MEPLNNNTPRGNHVAPSITPNVVVHNPDNRRTLNNTLSIIGLILATVITVDLATPAFDLSAWTGPIFAGYAYVAGFFGVSVIRPNIPKD